MSAGLLMSSIVELPMKSEDNGSETVLGFLPLIYEELRRLAFSQMEFERVDHTLTPTALLHEAWIRVAGSAGLRECSCRRYFFFAAAEAMRRILVEHARRHQRRSLILRSSAYKPTSDSESILLAPIDLLALDEALERLSACHPEKAELVKLRYYCGLPLPKAAELLEISLKTADRHWAYARAWLSRELSSANE